MKKPKSKQSKPKKAPKNDVLLTLQEIENHVLEKGETSYAELTKFCKAKRPEWYRALILHGSHIASLVKELADKAKSEATLPSPAPEQVSMPTSAPTPEPKVEKKWHWKRRTTVRELAHVLGVSVATIRRYAKGQLKIKTEPNKTLYLTPKQCTDIAEIITEKKGY